MEDDICLSGGADGADMQWGMVAGTMGQTVYHFIFQGHRSTAPKTELVVLSQEMLDEADPYLIKANETIGRRFPPSSRFVANLLRRNWYQVRDAEAVYAVSTIKKGLVQGGTSWAVQMFLDRHDGEPCRAYVFCQTADQWFVWNRAWEPLWDVPKPSGVWAGIGTRELATNGKEAIRRLLGYVKPSIG